MTEEDLYSVGIDIGGTFTDCVLRDSRGRFVFDKAFSTPGNLVDGVLGSLRNAGSQWGLSLESLLARVTVLKVGTTSTVNRLINRAGARTALITTRGHEDALFIGRVGQKTEGLPDAARTDQRAWGKAEPIVPRALVHGIDERVDCFGDVLRPLDRPAVERAVQDCLDQAVDSFAVCFLWSLANPAHERATWQIIRRLAPEAFVVLSSDIAPLIGEYERAATTVLNSYLGPGTAADLRSLEDGLRARGMRSSVFVMQSNGGVAAASEAFSRPVHLLGSGPVGGVAACRALSRRLEGSNAIATDMGGTSFDVGVVAGGKAIERRVSVHNRYRIFVSALEVTSIGAGGGSIAYLDPVTGVLQVGPHSAGAVPGPVCYGFGGQEPTVTDANAVLGRLNPERFFAGRRTLDVDAAREAISERIAAPLGSSVEEAAAAVLDIVDNRMADLIRNLTVERGLDPREFTVIAYGGGGPLHVGSYAREIGAGTVVIPRAAPVYSAWGIADSPVHQTVATSAPLSLPAPDDAIRSVFDELRARTAAGDAAQPADLERQASLFVDMRYRYQINELPVPVNGDELAADGLSALLMERFERLYEARFGAGTTFRAAGIEISSFRLARTQSLRFGSAAVWEGAGTDELPDERKVWFGDGFVSVPVYAADAVAAGFSATGPCVLEGRLVTAIVHPGQSVSVDDGGDFVLDTGC